jgi:hypothetical protein
MVKGFTLNAYLLQNEINAISLKDALDIRHTTCEDMRTRDVKQ